MAARRLLVVPRPTAAGRGGSALRHSHAVHLAAHGPSLLGKGVASVVMPLLVLDRTGDVLAAGVLATVATAASATAGLVSGLPAAGAVLAGVTAVIALAAPAFRSLDDPADGRGGTGDAPSRAGSCGRPDPPPPGCGVIPVSGAAVPRAAGGR